MTAFEFVFGLLSIIASLGLTHLVASIVNLIRNSERVRISPLHALWMWTAFATTIGNWGDLLITVSQFALVLLAIFVAARPAQWIAVLGTSVLSTIGMVDSCNILSA